MSVTEHYDAIVIGAGSAGLTASITMGEVGRKVALIERERIGGDCTWTGCIPSKALLSIAKTVHAARAAAKFGVKIGGSDVDMRVVRDHIRRVIDEIYQHETPEMVNRRGVDVILGDAQFIDAHTVQVGERRLSAKKIIIATGGRAAIPNIHGLTGVNFYTNATLFDNDRLPNHFLVIGAGPVGLEMAQAYVRLGARVTVIGERVLPRDEPEVAEVIHNVLTREGVKLITSRVERVSGAGDDITLHLKNGESVHGDMLLVAAGRTPNIETLNLGAAGVSFRPDGIPVNAQLQTNVPHIYAVGDVTTGPKFTHYAGFQASVAARHALVPLLRGNGLDEAHLPWVTFTEPEVAHVGLTEAAAREKYGGLVKVFTLPLSEGDRAVTEGDTDGFIKLVYRGTGELLGATVVAERAGEMIIEYTLAIKKKISLSGLNQIIHAYPTYSDIAKKAVSSLLLKELKSGTTWPILRWFVKRFA